ncbi:hypothetical protein D1007_00328 [Hordeum vulgare]|nr:hypothetical protein D1007_00328 [Hordeum vulgare]
MHQARWHWEHCVPLSYPDVTLPHHWHLDLERILVSAVPRSAWLHAEEVIDLALKLINPVIDPGEVFPNVNGIHLLIASELRDHHVVGIESTLHHPLTLEVLLLHCFEPRLHASGLLSPSTSWMCNIPSLILID